MNPRLINRNHLIYMYISCLWYHYKTLDNLDGLTTTDPVYWTEITSNIIKRLRGVNIIACHKIVIDDFYLQTFFSDLI